MATWNDIEKYIRAKYVVNPDSPAGFIGILFPIGDRSQLVFVRQSGNDQIGEWARISSPVGVVSAAKLKMLTQEALDLVCGGIVMTDDVAMLSHSVPLLNLDVNEFEAPLAAITISADVLEKKFTGKDDF